VIFFLIVSILNWKDPLKYFLLFANGIAGRLGVKNDAELRTLRCIFVFRRHLERDLVKFRWQSYIVTECDNRRHGPYLIYDTENRPLYGWTYVYLDTYSKNVPSPFYLHIQNREELPKTDLPFDCNSAVRQDWYRWLLGGKRHQAWWSGTWVAWLCLAPNELATGGGTQVGHPTSVRVWQARLNPKRLFPHWWQVRCPSSRLAHGGQQRSLIYQRI